MSDSNEIQIPEGDTGEFFITRKMLVNAPKQIEELNRRLRERSVSVRGGMIVEAIPKLDGYLVRWYPNPAGGESELDRFLRGAWEGMWKHGTTDYT